MDPDETRNALVFVPAALGNPSNRRIHEFRALLPRRGAIFCDIYFVRPVVFFPRRRGEQICRHALRTRVTMTRRGADPPRYVDETDDERATRLAAEEVHVRIERARRREVEDAYWRTREMALGVASVDHRRAPSSSSNQLRATPGDTPRWIADAHADADADAQSDDLARSTGVSRRIADEVLAAERSAILAAVGPPTSASASARVFGITPRAPPMFTPRSAALPRVDVDPSERSDHAFAFRDDAGDAAPLHHTNSPAMTNALWQMACTPPPTAARRAMGYRAFGETTAVHAARAARDALERAAEDARAANQLADRDDAADVDARSDAGETRRRGGAAENQSAERRSRDGGGERSAVSARAHAGAFLGEKIDERRGGGEGTVARGVGVCVRRRGRRVAALLRGRRRPTEDGDEGGEGTIARGVRANAGTFVGAFAGASWGVAASAPPAPVKFPWTTEDAEAVRAARAAVRRAEAAEAAVLEEERRARAATKAAVATLLDARVRLAAATARSVAEEAASAAVFAAAEVASLKLAMEGVEGNGNGDEEGGGKENVDDPFSEALAEYAKIPLPVVPKA